MNTFYLIQMFADFITYTVFNLEKNTRIANALNFFIFDIIKISILIFIIVFLMTILRSFLPAEKIRRFLNQKYTILGNILAAFLGIFTPFCTCSSIPLFLGLIQAGVPMGTTFSYLISSPMINEVAIVLLFGLFGWKITLIYITSGYIISVLAGFILGKLNLEHLLDDSIRLKINTNNNISIKFTISQRLKFAMNNTAETLKTILPYILIGIGFGAWIHGYVPTSFISNYAGGDSWYAVILATLIGIPLYSNAAGVLPLLSVLIKKGMFIGTALSFMMAVTALSLPEFLILKKIMKLKLILIFASIVGIGIIFTGYLFNFLFNF